MAFNLPFQRCLLLPISHQIPIHIKFNPLFKLISITLNNKYNSTTEAMIPIAIKTVPYTYITVAIHQRKNNSEYIEPNEYFNFGSNLECLESNLGASQHQN